MAAKQNFNFESALDVGIGAFGGFLDWFSRTSNAKANNELAEARRNAANTVAHSRNSLAATVRTINNQRLMEAADRAYEAESLNLARGRDAFAGSRFEQSIRDSERAGALASGIAASGVGGSAIDAVGNAAMLQAGRLQFQLNTREAQWSYNAAARLSGIIPNAYAQRDISPIGGNVDTTSAATDIPGNDIFGLLTAVTAGVLGKKDSLQTFLGSLEPGRSATANPVYQGSVSPYALPDVYTQPVRQSQITGTPLDPIQLTSQPVLPVSSTLGGV